MAAVSTSSPANHSLVFCNLASALWISSDGCLSKPLARAAFLPLPKAFLWAPFPHWLHAAFNNGHFPVPELLTSFLVGPYVPWVWELFGFWASFVPWYPQHQQDALHTAGTRWIFVNEWAPSSPPTEPPAPFLLQNSPHCGCSSMLSYCLSNLLFVKMSTHFSPPTPDLRAPRVGPSTMSPPQLRGSHSLDGSSSMQS